MIDGGFCVACLRPGAFARTSNVVQTSHEVRDPRVGRISDPHGAGRTSGRGWAHIGLDVVEAIHATRGGRVATRHRSRSALHLLWTVPCAIVLAAYPLFWGGTSVCGVSGCEGGGYGPSYGPNYEWITAFIVVGILLAAPIFLVPWQRLAIRLTVALAVGVVVSGGLIWHAFALKYPLSG